MSRPLPENWAELRAARKSRYWHKNKDAITARKHGLTVERVNAILEEQGGLCAICGKDGPLVIDHDHHHCPGPRSCGECVRGMICQGCNKLLGFAEDRRHVLASAMEYLRTRSFPPRPGWPT